MKIATTIAKLDKQHKHPIPQSYTVIGYTKTGKPKIVHRSWDEQVLLQIATSLLAKKASVK